MSIKDLFDKPERLLSQDSEEITSEIESVEYISVKNEKDKTFIPDVDFSDPKNFARFGLAEEYYRQAITYIQNTYPYDGSEKEVVDWGNKLTYLERYVFDKQYPKTTGYVTLNNDSYVSGTITAITSSGIVIASSSIGQYIGNFGRLICISLTNREIIRNCRDTLG